ncbi:hypothetical protein RIR_e28995_A0A2I1E264_9GLOM [Rhizophagus irregularis DAOM 181602=DAOM 197198]|nr:hypothetical protein RhiirB3_29735 [Rhizophagus irregularis]GET54400.1 hypothetical protein RIR_e28995_A0A2I1E264_9GLOM [Rhizophagus irregularis DAOM 181602=DAOM 197198]
MISLAFQLIKTTIPNYALNYGGVFGNYLLFLPTLFPFYTSISKMFIYYNF